MEWAKYGIRVNSVSPGLVKTAMAYWVEQQPDWEQQLNYYGGIPRLAEVEELGGAYVYVRNLPCAAISGRSQHLASTALHSLLHTKLTCFNLQLLSDAASYTTSIDIPVNGVIGSEC